MAAMDQLDLVCLHDLFSITGGQRTTFGNCYSVHYEGKHGVHCRPLSLLLFAFKAAPNLWPLMGSESSFLYIILVASDKTVGQLGYVMHRAARVECGVWGCEVRRG
jgi:hypothetical protein